MLRIGTSRCSMVERAELQSLSRKDLPESSMNRHRNIFMRSNEVDKGMLGPQCAAAYEFKIQCLIRWGTIAC
jgi:hypothetical protein